MKIVIVSKMTVEVDLETYNKGKGLEIDEAISEGKVKMHAIPEFIFQNENGEELEDNDFIQAIRESIYV